ncbi:pyridoxal phosphate-dependent decarboxylase family protein [Catenulispora rubra]|uniref:pyridoxal phosphate-dependent decarboxylase family protein n=1 Tax=Catenulispora rubra TaxID=280293 RepID=UPI0018923180|nr:aminotransferase class I/II-fold pyridoxal phosphate-dependent enzyme [Catenulispora rubra]
MNDFPLEPDRAAMAEMGGLVLDRVLDHVESLPDRPAGNPVDPRLTADLVESFLSPPPEAAGDLRALLDRLDGAVDCALETSGPGYLAYVPGGGLYSSALAEFYARGINKYGSFAFAAPALVALEEGILRWIARDVCGLPDGSTGLLTTGGSMATFSAVVAARHDRLGEDLADGTVYVTAYTHHSVAKACRLAGISARNIRTVPCTDDLRMDMTAAAAMIGADRAAGLRPFLLVGSAGTTDAGTVDPLPAMADLAAREDLWLHVDGAYGGFFRLTERGRRRLAGTERADSVTLDPHKTLFLPFGTGTLVVRDPAKLYAAHDGTGNYLQEVVSAGGLPNYAHMGPELSHEIRGLRAWIPLHLHGVSAFRDALDEKLDLAEQVHDVLSGISALEVPWRPDLSTVAFRVRSRSSSAAALEEADQATRDLLARINDDPGVLLSSTVTHGRQTIRVCVLGHHTHADRIDEVLELIAAQAKQL